MLVVVFEFGYPDVPGVYVEMAEAFAHMHPKTARLVLAYQRTVWLIDECDVNEVCEWYLKADPRIESAQYGWAWVQCAEFVDRKSTRLNSSHSAKSRMPSSA